MRDEIMFIILTHTQKEIKNAPRNKSKLKMHPNNKKNYFKEQP